MTNSRSPGSRSAEARSPTKSLLLVDENKQLREKLYKALSIHDPNVIENYKDLSSDELIAQILHLKAEVEVLQKIKTRMDENNQNGVADIEVEKLNSEIHHLKSDRLSYYEESEKKDLEIKNLKEELEQIRKELSGKNRTMYGAIPKVPSQVSQNVETKSKIRSKLEVLKKSSATTTSSFESSAKKTLTISKPKAAAAATSKNLALSAVTPQNGAAASKSKQKITKEVTSPVRNGHSPIVGAAAVAKSKSASSKQSPKASLKQSPKDQNEVEKFRQNVAAKKIQQSWKSHRSDVIENGNKIEDKPADNKENHNGIEDKPTNGEENCNGVENKMINFEGNRNNDDDELKDLQEAVTTIQSVARGNEVRSDLLCGDAFGETSVETNEITKEETSECMHDSTKDVDDNVTTIQSVARAHHHREEILKTWETNGDAIVVSSTVGDGTNN